ncbi:ABC transporter permease [Edwardsiella anguillarum]|uniref:ABC transporter permease n=1 Tax=Edwardsiella TaxID=635 RepID=UPI0024B63C8A|nr:ABC transporter permease [Edwardsiella anguillarum]WHP79869.1 ABC transporter permease [Edwardsiella anguillarum]WHQ17330.1 ABC transporter permease [Edwardsiella anguillarum]WHQ20867.1 ABC transporter permease [Edwardsiella anguillarum]WHQ24389.1 ABC transporter permease [Edwardsiella anguillarum]WHQ27958.1 ABC transporter permease [Edwardsiella anguillarum]
MAKTSIKSTALETRVSLRRDGTAAWLGQVLTRYGLLILCVALIGLFALTTPSFASLLTLQAILGSKAKIALLALAATVPMIVGKIDLNVGFGIVLWHILAITLQVEYGLAWPLAVLVVLGLAALYGLLNGLLVALADIDSFVATLGSGTVLYAIALWHSGGRQIVGTLPEAFTNLHHLELFGLPVVALYVVLTAVALWLVTEHTPVGRCMYVVGGNPIAAALNGIAVNRYVIGAFVTSSLLTGFTGVIIAAEQGIGQASVGMDYLLPALVGAFLGSTTIRPGRVNVWGSVVGIAVLAIGIAGIQQFGGAFWVEPLFNGTTLLLSITLAGYAQRHRRSRRASRQAQDADVPLSSSGAS